MRKQEIIIVGLTFRMEYYCPGTDVWFRDFLYGPKEEIIPEDRVLSVPQKKTSRTINGQNGALIDPAFLEFSLLLGPTADRILSYNRCIFHGAAFSWQGRAYILTAPSGIGKTTQLKNWKALNKEDFRIIDGDKPALRYMEDGSILVYPSPWSGKERWRGGAGKPYPLKGVIYLRQGKEDRIRRLSPEDAVLPVFTQILYTGRTVADIKSAADCVERILRTVPVWELVNTGGLRSAVLTREAVTAYEGE